MISIKSKHEIELMQESGRIVALAHEKIREAIKPGITTGELDQIAEDLITAQGAVPSFKGYGGFPAAICASINDQVIHGIPGSITLKEGDIISVDIGALKNGYHADAARTHPVGKVSEKALKLIKVTEESFFEGLKFCRVGYRLSDVSNAIQKYAEAMALGSYVNMLDMALEESFTKHLQFQIMDLQEEDLDSKREWSLPSNQ